MCVEEYRINSDIMSHFLYLKIGSKIDCVVYTGMYNFMKEIPVYIFAVKITVYIDLRCFITDKRVGVSLTLLCNYFTSQARQLFTL